MNNYKFSDLKSGVVLPFVVLCLLAMIILPLPPLVLDLFFAVNLAVALLIFAKTVNVDRPLAFTTFPAIILIATLFRLAMNVASTRIILLEGHNGSEAAGSVIESFGAFVIGGQYVVGIIVFSILVVINFIVITKGTGRVSEVSARFKLDSLPGKQMAIDADLNTGTIDADEAAKKREELQLESDFYGAMDGASKFVKGDAVAGIVILLINIFGGIIIGMTAHSMTFGDASQSYILLSVGDGIVAQIPGLILSIATGVIITRAGKRESLGEQVRGEFLINSTNFYATASILGVLGIIPAMPQIFLLFAMLLAGLGYYIDYSKNQNISQASEVVAEEVQSTTKEVTWDDINHVKPLEVQVGFGLADWIKRDESEIVNRLKGLRKKLSQDLGFLVSPISVQDDLALDGYVYCVKLHGEKVAEFELHPSKLLAIGDSLGGLRGQQVVEPSFGMNAVWVDPQDKGMAEAMDGNVIEPEMVLTTHLSVIIKNNAGSLFGFDEAKKLIDKTSETSPHLVEEFNKKIGGTEKFTKVMKYLLNDELSLRDIKNILRVMIESYEETLPPVLLAQHVRNALGRTIINSIFGSKPVELITLESNLQSMLVANVAQNGINNVAIEPNMANKLVEVLTEVVNGRALEGKPSVMAVDQNIRWQIAETIGKRVSDLHVIAVEEIPSDSIFEIIYTFEA